MKSFLRPKSFSDIRIKDLKLVLDLLYFLEKPNLKAFLAIFRRKRLFAMLDFFEEGKKTKFGKKALADLRPNEILRYAYRRASLVFFLNLR